MLALCQKRRRRLHEQQVSGSMPSVCIRQRHVQPNADARYNKTCNNSCSRQQFVSVFQISDFYMFRAKTSWKIFQKKNCIYRWHSKCTRLFGSYVYDLGCTNGVKGNKHIVVLTVVETAGLCVHFGLAQSCAEGHPHLFGLLSHPDACLYTCPPPGKLTKASRLLFACLGCLSTTPIPETL